MNKSLVQKCKLRHRVLKNLLTVSHDIESTKLKEVLSSVEGTQGEGFYRANAEARQGNHEWVCSYLFWFKPLESP
jgi:hypothetical protein